MFLRINQLLYVISLFLLAESASNELLPLMNIGDACPGNLLMFRCNIIGGGNTIWSGTAFDCPSKSDEIILRHSQFSLGTTFGNCNSGAISARGLTANMDCYSSQLNVTVNPDMNNRTIECVYSTDTVETIGVVTLSIVTGPYPPPTNILLAEVQSGKLIFSWTASANHPTGIQYAINSTCGTCPDMTNATMVTCSNLRLLNIVTVCTFSIRSIVCGDIGSPSLPIMVALGVPDIPNVRVTPQYSLNDRLTKIIVVVDQNVTSFSITDSISGSVTSYDVLFSVKNLTLTPCMEDTCEYIVDVPVSSCPMSDNVDISIAAANGLGRGPYFEPTKVECSNQFVRVNYDSTTETVSCIFQNQADSSSKSCSVKYGVCGQEVYTNQDSTTEQSPFIVMLKLNSSAIDPMNCYIVTASNDTLTFMVKGNFETPSTSDSVGTGLIVGLVIIIIVILAVVTAAVIVPITFIVIHRRKYRQDGCCINGKGDTEQIQQNSIPMKELESANGGEQDSSSQQLIQINSTQFKVTEVVKDSKLETFGKYAFLESTHYSSKEETVDVILKKKNGHLFSGPAARSSQGKQGDWDKVFVLPLRECGGEMIKKTEYVLHQDHDQLKLKFKVFRVEKEVKMSEFLKQHSTFVHERIFYEFPKNGMDLLHYRDIVKVPHKELKRLKKLRRIPPEEELLLESDTGIRMFYNLKPHAPGKSIKPPDKRYFVQSTPQDSKHLLKTGSLVLYKGQMDADVHRRQTRSS